MALDRTNVSVGALPDQWIALEALTIVKCLDLDGDPALAIRVSDGLTPWEMLGMAQAAVVSLEGEIKRLMNIVGDTNDD